ncbi:MAG: helix-turn-helix domain-containing protein, partial [Bacteroidales bacterium]|nr:helix-turn-helix domain-containing protein [Bacteroidales bacterium]
DENKEDLKKQIGCFIFYPQHLELHFNHCVRKLSQREAQIIQLLTADTSMPVMRKKILLELWGDDSFYNSRNLDVYISRLRDYFSEDPNIKIVTLKGLGYHFKIL